MFKYCIIFLLLFSTISVAQTIKIDSLQKVLQTQKQDTNRVISLWKLAEQYQFFKPDTTLQLAQHALLLAKHLNYIEGESRSLAVMATGQYLIGNYPAALNNYMLKLQIEEKRNSLRNYASALNNIGLMYILLAEYPNALSYLHRADSTVQLADIAVKNELQNRILINLGETFYRMKKADSANKYFTKALQAGINNNDGFIQGASRLGIANVQAELGNDSTALLNYKMAIPFLNDGTNNDMLCETALGLSKIFQKNSKPDSALFYGLLAYNTAKKDGFLSRELDAANFLSLYYKKNKKFDEAFQYLELGVALQDSIKGQAKTKETMIISSNEQLRQAEIAEQKILDKQTRLQQLQLLAICIFIPTFFMLTFAISRIKVNKSIIKFMCVVSLLLFFEFLVLLLHPVIGEITHHNKVLELLILVIIGAGLVPLHHKLEHVVLDKLTKQKDSKNLNLEQIELLEMEDEHTEELLLIPQNYNANEENEEVENKDLIQKKSALADDTTKAD